MRQSGLIYGLVVILTCIPAILLAACGTQSARSDQLITQPPITSPPASVQPSSARECSVRVAPTGALDEKTLAMIPDSAEIIASATWAGNKARDGAVSNELYVMDSTGGNITRITFSGTHYNHFAVSPNRMMIAATRFGDTSSGFNEFSKKTLWILDLEYKKEWPLVPELDAGYGGVDWSPDGRHVYFSVFKNGVSDIYRVAWDGTDLTNVTERLDLQLPFPSAADRSPKWISDVGVSHDGQWIAFHYQRQGAQKGVIGICRTDGTQTRVLTDGGPMKAGKYGPYSAGDFDPEFSPDGTHIVFARTTGIASNWLDVTSHDIMTIRVDGTELKDLSPAGNTGTSGIPDWSEDNRILFTDWNKQNMFAGPVIVNPDGSSYHRLQKANGASWVRWIPPVKNRYLFRQDLPADSL